MDRLSRIAISLHCWQGDDVGGFESAEGLSGGGIMATGNYPGKARTADELRADVEKTLSLIPGKHRLNLHAMYAETKGKVDRNELEPKHFAKLGPVGQGQRARHGLQRHVLLPSQGRRRLHALQPRRGHPQVLGRARDRLPQDRGLHGQGARHALRDEYLDSRRLQGHPRGPQRPAGTAEEVAR